MYESTGWLIDKHQPNVMSKFILMNYVSPWCKNIQKRSRYCHWVVLVEDSAIGGRPTFDVPVLMNSRLVLISSDNVEY